MIQMIQQALTMGYTAAQVLNYVSRKFKKAQPGINNAKQQGYSDEDILKFLGNKIKPKNKKALNEQLSDQEKYMKSVGMKTRQEKEETRNKYISGAINLGLTALGAYNMYQGYKGLGSTFGLGGTAQPPQLPGPIGPTGQAPMGPGPNSPGVHVVNTPNPGNPLNPMPGAPQTPGQTATPQTPMPGPNIGQQIQQNAQSPVNTAMQPQSLNQLGQASQALQPTQSLFDQLVQGVDIESLDKSKKDQMKFFRSIADQLQKQGKTIESPEIQKLQKNIKKTLEGKSGLLLQEATRGLSEVDQEAQKIAPESIVSTPQGVGEVKGVSNGKAIVEIDGKAHKINEKEIEPPPIPEKDLADLHNELIRGIEKSTGKQVSRNVNWAGYDPEAKELQYRPWNGDSYTFNDIEPEDVEMLTNFLTQRKTTGENFIGAWEEGTESPIGAAMHKLIMKLKEKAKEKGGKEYSKKYQTVYSAYEPAEKAAKLKKKLAEQEERKRKKNGKKT